MMISLKTSQRKGGKAKRGFTLIELMVATSLMMFLVAIVLQLTGSILTTWNRAYTKLTANFGARQAMDIMVSDLESAIVKSSSLGTAGRNWIEIFISDPDDVDSDLGRFDNIFFFSPTTIRQKMTRCLFPATLRQSLIV